jgi:hypothetical protein
MAGNAAAGGGRRGNRWRIALWSVAALILLMPLIAMQFTDEVAWTAFDFVFAGALLLGVGLTFELAASRTGSITYRAGVAVALLAALLIIWSAGAVGIIGAETHPANLMYGGVLAIALVGVFVAGFRPLGMARAMFAAASAHALAGVIALAAGWGATDASWPWDIVMSTGFFAALWLVSAWLFRKAARDGAPTP